MNLAASRPEVNGVPAVQAKFIRRIGPMAEELRRMVDRGGKYLGFFPPGTSAEKIGQMIEPYLRGKDER